MTDWRPSFASRARELAIENRRTDPDHCPGLRVGLKCRWALGRLPKCPRTMMLDEAIEGTLQKWRIEGVPFRQGPSLEGIQLLLCGTVFAEHGC